MIRSPAGFDGETRIKRYQDYYQASYGVMMLSSGQFGAGTAAGYLLGAEPSGYATDFTAGGVQGNALVRSFPRNTQMDYSGTPFLAQGGPVTFSRGSLATVTDSNGYIKWAPHNLLPASEQFANATYWANNLVTISENSIAAPNGTVTSDKIVEQASSGLHFARTFVSTAAAQHVLSVFAKAGERSRLLVYNFTFAGGVDFNLSNGTIVGDIDAAPVSKSITAIGSGWYLCSVTFNCTAASQDLRFYLGNGSSYSYTGDGTSGLYLWGASLTRSDLGGMQANASAYPMYNPTTPKNLLGYSEDYSGTGWARAFISATANAAISPNGLLTADKLVPANGASSGNIYNNPGTTIVSGGTYTASVYVKAAELGFAYISLNVRASSAVGGVCVNLTTGALSNQGASATYSVVDAGNGWWRVSCTGVSNTTSGYLEVFPLASAGSFNSYTGNGTSGIYAWGAQLSDSASLDPYVPNFGAAPSAAAAHGPRLDYDPVTLAAKGLLVEEQRANLLTYSSEFDNAAWSSKAALNTTGTPAWINVGVAPDGTTTADRIIPNTNSDFHYIGRTVTVTSGIAYTASFYAKNDGYGFIRLYDATSGSNTVFTLSGAGSTSSVTGTPSITPIGTNGWYRCTLTFTTSSTSCQPFLYPQSTASMVAFAGDGSSGVLLWGAQLEAGSFATSYIPTAASTVTRNADVASVATSQFPYSATEGTLVANGSPLASVANTTNVIAELGDGGATNIFEMYRVSGATNGALYVASGGVASTITISNAFPANAASKFGGVYKVNDFQAAANGTLGTPVTSGAVPTAASNLYIGKYGGGTTTQWNGHIRQITYLPRRVTNAELQTRTA